MTEENNNLSVSELSPADKLQDGQPVGTLIPGVENPESAEVKKEINPNTE